MINWDAIGAIGEVVGAIAVFATLAYFGLQMRLTARVAAAESERETLLEWQRSSAAFVRGGPRLLASLDGFRDVSEEDVHYCLACMNDVMFAHLAIWRMNESGMLPEESMETFDRVVCLILSTPSGAIWWREGKFAWPNADYVDDRLECHDGSSWLDWNREFLDKITSIDK